MTYEEWNASDEFRITLFISEEDATNQEHALEELLEVFEHQQAPLLPEKVLDGARASKYSRAQARKILAKRSDWPRWLYLQREGLPRLSVCFTWSAGWARLQIEVRLTPLASLREEDSHLARADQLVSLVRSLCALFPVSFGYAHSVVDLASGSTFFPASLSDLTPPPFIGWLNVFGRDMVESLGRERVLSLPTHSLEPLAHGSVLFLTRPSVRDFDSHQARLAQARALCHLLPELSLEDTLKALLQRSLLFQPLAPSFHPDVAPLLHLLIGRTPLKERRARMESFNALVPPPVSERLPLSQAPSCDVADPQSAIRLYEGLHAERLCALLHKDLPDVVAQTPDTLPAVDDHAEHRHWAFANPEVVEGDCIPMLGGYLGLLMVRHLGGRWVPRQRLEEVQVIVGASAWLPFLRARHLLEARREASHAFLHSSLTQFYFTAAREASRQP